MVLAIIAKHKDRLRDRRLVERYDALVERLGEDGWAYPLGLSSCKLVGQRDEVRRLTSELLDLWKESEGKRGLRDDEDLYHREVSGD